MPDREAGHHAPQVGLPVARARRAGARAGRHRPGSHGPGSGSAAERRGSGVVSRPGPAQRLRPARGRQPGHERRDLVRAHVVEDVPREHGVEALVRREGQQPLERRVHGLRLPVLDRLGAERSMEVGDSNATRERREELDVARERWAEVEHGAAATRAAGCPGAPSAPASGDPAEPRARPEKATPRTTPRPAQGCASGVSGLAFARRGGERSRPVAPRPWRASPATPSRRSP